MDDEKRDKPGERGRKVGGADYIIRIRRSIDGAERDFGLDDNGDLDTEAIVEFIGDGDGFVSLYDQGEKWGVVEENDDG